MVGRTNRVKFEGHFPGAGFQREGNVCADWKLNSPRPALHNSTLTLINFLK